MRKKNFLRAVFVFAILSMVACASGRRPTPVNSGKSEEEIYGPVIPDSHVEEQTVPDQAYGPAAPAGTQGPAPEPTPAPAASSAKLCLVLGPGMAKAMAEAAVLDSLSKAKIPVHCVVGSEMGAIVGALYAFSNGKTNNLNWQLFKLTKDTYLHFPMISLREPRSSGQQLHGYLEKIFRDARIETLKIPFATNAVSDENDNTIDMVSGLLSDALSASSAVPGIFDSWKAGGASFRSAVTADPAPVELARKLGGNFIVIVDVLLQSGASKSRFHRAFTPARSLIKLQKKEAQFTIEVDTSSIAFDDFGRQGEILSAGSSAAEKALPDLKAAWEKFSAGSH